MNIREIDLRINRNNFPGGTGGEANLDLRRRIYAAWTIYNESQDAGEADAAYAEWSQLVQELSDIEPFE